MAENNKISVFGIRHHGPGSARSLLNGLQKLQPDCILLEGPPEANEMIKHVSSEQMKPPVSLLIYAPDDPRQAVYYPFAAFSPEWQALVYGRKQNVPVRFMDLPQSNWLALQNTEHPFAADLSSESLSSDQETSDRQLQFEDLQKELKESDEESETESGSSNEIVPPSFNIRKDPLSFLAKAAGYDDSERWWENLVEHRREDLDVFSAIKEAMTSLRSELSDQDLVPDRYEAMREAQMRQTIRAAQKEGFKNIAVVCGAWHAPVLTELPPAKDDQALLKGLPKIKVEATWIPWTHARLSFASGYGAGVQSPGWYHHLWTCKDHIVERWVTHVARLLREEDLDASSAHIIETVRLAEALASMREQPLPGLTEIAEASQSVLCFGNAVPMQLIHEKLEVGDLMGEVPADVPGTPLQKNLEKEQKRLRMPAQAGEKFYDLDLRNANDLARSHLLHRLEVLGIAWGKRQELSGKSGTFHEAWQLRWMPEFALTIIEASIWGKTVEESAGAFACNSSDQATELAALTCLLDKVLLANLPGAVDHVMRRVENEAALAVDIKHLMNALPALVQVARYGNVRKTDISSVSKIIDGLVSRICIGLPSACSSLDEAAAQEIFELILSVHSAIGLLQNPDHDRDWQDVLLKLADSMNMNGLILGRACRLLFDRKVFDSREAARRFGLALSTASDATLAAAFADGFLRGGGVLLIHDSELFAVVDNWVQELNEESFTQILPFLRRTFSTYAPPERRQIGQRVARSGCASGAAKARIQSFEIDKERAEKVLAVAGKIFGLVEQADTEANSK